jgi:hypothetical protein
MRFTKNLTKYNTDDPADPVQPYYKKLTYDKDLYLVYSTQVDSMPVTTF